MNGRGARRPGQLGVARMKYLLVIVQISWKGCCFPVTTQLDAPDAPEIGRIIGHRLAYSDGGNHGRKYLNQVQ
ncbi:hypothetical protein BJ165DRAFT_713152 [Panaeolus papilionaceus]|nr:hypothetical protein BJ165DRAFT_713152 [Panaeolus papilionaceus]